MRKVMIAALLSSMSCGGAEEVPPPAADMAQPPSPVQAMAPAFPPGSMIAFAGPVAPAGWWLCDGKAVSRDDYPDLFKVIGSSWGDGGDGDGPLFNVPDMRGLFPRGVDAGAKRDPEASQRTSITQGGNAGDRVGSVQSYATAPPKTPFSTMLITGIKLIYEGGASSFTRVGSDALQNTSLTLSGGDAETRPRNVGVNWIVKY